MSEPVNERGKPTISVVVVQPTPFCNINCNYCYLPARNNKATREELSGSTITITSLGKLGGIASTPIINAPEVAIIGVNRAIERPVVIDGAIAIRRTMNLSSSFDHRFVDGYDAAAMIQALKESLEHPATIFIDR